MKNICIFACTLILMTGCLSVIRIPFPVHQDFSDDGVCTNRVYETPLRKIQRSKSDYVWKIYPTIGMRYYSTYCIYGNPIDENLKGEKLYNAKMAKRFGWIPLTVMWLTSPFDAIIDTIAVPFDLWCVDD